MLLAFNLESARMLGYWHVSARGPRWRLSRITRKVFSEAGQLGLWRLWLSTNSHDGKDEYACDCLRFQQFH